MNALGLHHASVWMHDIRALGWCGWLFFIGIYASSCLFFVPGSVLTFAAGAIYGFWKGLFLALVGNGAASLLCLLIARYILRDLAAKRFAKRPELMEALKAAVEKDGWRIVCLTHLSPIVPFSLINYAFGLTTIPVGEFLLATVLGTVPATCVYVYLGSLVGHLAAIGPEMRLHRPLEWFLQGLGLAATVAVTLYITRTARRALKKRLPARKK